ncbi:hypothetical protein V1264_002400 [Littorina saxatilis]
MVRVEVGKMEVRSRKAHWMRMDKFLKDYLHSDLYMVHSVSGRLKDLVLIPPTLQCGGYQRAMQEAVVWMGKGPLRSVLHYDEVDNLLCVFDGTKDVVLIDKFYKEKVEANGFVQDGHYSTVDMEKVDMHSFPQFQNLPWYRVHLAAGDCVYIPYRWYHQVTSQGDRSLAVNIWFARLWWFDDDDCTGFGSSHTLEPLDDYGFASPNEAVRSQWLEAFEGADDDVDLADFLGRVSSGTQEHRRKVHQLIDKDQDGMLAWIELYDFDISKALPLYPDVFMLSADPSGGNATQSVHGDQETSKAEKEHEAKIVQVDMEEEVDDKVQTETGAVIVDKEEDDDEKMKDKHEEKEKGFETRAEDEKEKLEVGLKTQEDENEKLDQKEDSGYVHSNREEL